jgi:ATP-binding cassette, subfamily B, bacterial
MNIPLKQYWDLLVGYLKPQRFKVIALGVLLLVQILLQLYSPQVLRAFIDGALAGAATDTLIGIALAFIVLTLVVQVLSVAATYVGQDVGWTATNALRAALAEHCVALDMAFHKARTPGEMIERIDGDVTALANFFSQFALLLLGNALLLLGTLIVVWREDGRVGLALTALALMAFLMLNLSRRWLVPYNIANRQANAALYGALEERLAGVEDIRANGAGAFVTRQFDCLQSEVYRSMIVAETMGIINDVFSIVFFGAMYVGVLALGVYLFRAGEMSVGTIFLLVRYTQMLRDPMQVITRQLQDLQKASAGIVRIRELLGLRKQVQDGDGARLPNGAFSVAFDGVSFEYDDDHYGVVVNGNGSDARVLHDLSFDLQSGKILGLLGRTGSGKTTLTRLLLRLYDPSAGGIHLGGVDIRTARLAELRRAIGMVTQEVQLFHATLRENLTLFDASIPDERILCALKELGLWAWYESLPGGLDTELGAGGGGLSAGEAQLLAFTRVLLKNPSLVILDEASSRLDPATERLIERAVDKLLLGRTGIIIAHRLGTVQRADEIMILDEGRIGEHGARAQLASDPRSRFYHLLQTGLEEVLV